MYTTKRQEIEHVNRLKKFLSSKNIECDFETVSEERLNNPLRWFYHDLRKMDGSVFALPV